MGLDIEPVRLSQGYEVETREFVELNALTIRAGLSTLKDEGFERIGIITRNREFTDTIKTFDLGNEGENVLIMPVYEAKGLEFDAAIVVDTFNRRFEKEMLYTACTRAQHKLIVYKEKTTRPSGIGGFLGSLFRRS